VFTANQVLPGVWHITDAMGVCMTLITGSERALLVDAGYGLEDVAAFVRTLTTLPLTVMLTHCHHDHAIGAQWFPEVYILPEDHADYAFYTTDRRVPVRDQALAKGLTMPDRFMTAVCPEPLVLAEGVMDLGGVHCEIIRCPGHTPGSAVVLVKERRLLLTGDNWNPCTWLFFPEAVPVQTYREHMRTLFERSDFDHVLCSHQPMLFGRETPEAFLKGLTDEALEKAVPVDLWPGGGIDPRHCDTAPGQFIVFDYNKFRQADPALD